MIEIVFLKIDMKYFWNIRLLLEVIGFYVYMFNVELSFSVYYIFIFDEVKINVGGGYN